MENFKLIEKPLDQIKSGEVLLQGLYCSVYPHMRGKMNNAKSYVSPFNINEPLKGLVIATILEIKSDNFEVGDTVVEGPPWKEIFVSKDNVIQKLDTNIPELSDYLSIVGMTG